MNGNMGEEKIIEHPNPSNLLKIREIILRLVDIMVPRDQPLVSIDPPNFLDGIPLHGDIPKNVKMILGLDKSIAVCNQGLIHLLSIGVWPHRLPIPPLEMDDRLLGKVRICKEPYGCHFFDLRNLTFIVFRAMIPPTIIRSVSARKAARADQPTWRSFFMQQPTAGFVGVSEYLKLPRSSETWLLRDLLPTGGAALIYSPAKVGKSAIAIQMATALSGEYRDWMGFEVCCPGRVLYLQLDTPRTTWAERFIKLIKHGIKFNDEFFKLADKDSIGPYPFDILQPTHMKHLQGLVSSMKPVAVVIDTLREAHSGDEDSSTAMRNVITNLVGATSPAALIIISHDRKPHPDADKDIISDHRGSSYVVGRMDAIIRLTKTRMYYIGRSIEEGSVKLKKEDCDGALIWSPDESEIAPLIRQVQLNPELTSRRERARVLAPLIHKTEEATNSLLRRWERDPARQKLLDLAGLVRVEDPEKAPE
jgi:hypothetical protein